MKEHAARTFALVLGATILLDAALVRAEGWESMEPMPAPRVSDASATIGDRWYVAGGASAEGNLKQYPTGVHVYDQASGEWATVGELTRGRASVEAILDAPRARVLFAGGLIGVSGSLPDCDIASSHGVSPAPSLVTPRYLHASAFAADRFVVSGGWGIIRGAFIAMMDDAEVLEAGLTGWSTGGTMPAGARAGHTMTTLGTGKDILVVGGCRSDHAMTEVDLFDAANGTWSTVASLGIARCRHKALLLGDKRVFVAGSIILSKVENSAEIFDPTTGRWRPAAPMKDARYDFDMVLLPDGRVLVAGGSSDSANGEYGALESAEVYDPVADHWTSVPPMHDRRRWPTLAVLSDGVYVAGGSNASSTTPSDAAALASVERLPWADLGIGSGQSDAGMLDGSPSDTDAPTDGAVDFVPHDGLTDSAQPADALTDGALGDSISDDRGPGGGAKGCSCTFPGTADPRAHDLMVVGWIALGAAVRRRRRAGKG